MAALLLGVGNLLLTDEAIGVEVIRAFEQHYHTPDALEVVALRAWSCWIF